MATTTPPLRALLYTRVSTKAQAEKHGTALQRDALTRMAESRGWDVVGTFGDDAISGSTRKRPQLDAMMRAVRQGQADVVAVWRFDRFARSVSHLVGALAEFRERKVEFVSVAENIDTTTPLGRALFHIAAVMAELEADIAKERVQAGVDAARARGVALGRPEKITGAEARAAIAEHGGKRAAARALRVGTATLDRALEREQRRQGDAPGGAE